jgi:hypothetical protein
MFVARSNGILVGTVALAEAPPGYIAHHWEAGRPFPRLLSTWRRLPQRGRWRVEA